MLKQGFVCSTLCCLNEQGCLGKIYMFQNVRKVRENFPINLNKKKNAVIVVQRKACNKNNDYVTAHITAKIY
jgi:hypothetical protein